MKNRLAVITLFILAAALGYLFSRSKNVPPLANHPSVPLVSTSPTNGTNRTDQSTKSYSTTNSSAPETAPAPPPAPNDLSARAGQLIQDTTLATNLPAETVMHNVQRAIQQYGRMFGGNPVGTNPEITRALTGANPKHINFVDPTAGMNVNANGELVDEWGTPYFFHQLSASDMEIHSAGPDKRMWTSDDIVVH